ncbi:hypothetical protein DBV05_g11685 [Lasiodiplodia theobromae]|uniref:Uncharacterized protein n=1 Tax=Lasiodiplodia theobromae TaxID=45133 RepID=A0A5N5CWF2_9PEZI|nr:hypothetical protein DBV05_g11685 [Lasiodiplodia theobromae]
MTASTSCASRQDLLAALTLAVETVHPAAVAAIVDYLANPLSDDDLADLVQSLGPADGMTPAASARLLDRINRAKTRYATFLRARNLHDVRIQWPYEHSLQTLGLLHSRDLATFFEGLWSRRYTHCAAPRSYRSFSVVVTSPDFARLCTFAQDRRVAVTENVLQTFGPLERGSTPRSMQDIHLQMAAALCDIHNHRFDSATPTIERGNEPWFPFPNVVRQSNEIIAPPRFENMLGRRLDSIKDWDRGKAADVVLKNVAPPKRRAARRNIDKTKMPSHWKDLDNGQREDFFSGKLGDRSARGPVRWPELPVIKEDRQYDKAARKPPPNGYQMDALSNSGEDSASVAVASLSTVNGDLRRMKSFVRKPSRGELIMPSADVEMAQAEPLPTPPSPTCVVPMSGRPPSDTGLATPPDSASPVKPQGPSKRFNRRAPSAASRVKARRPQIRRSTPNKTNSSSTTTTSSRAESIYSMEDLNKTSAQSSSTTPSPPQLWSNPFECCKIPERRTSSGLTTFSPTKQATTSVQHIEASAERALFVGQGIAVLSERKEEQFDEIPQKPRTERIDSAITPIHRTAVDALKDSMSPKDAVAMSGETISEASHRW